MDYLSNGASSVGFVAPAFDQDKIKTGDWDGIAAQDSGTYLGFEFGIDRKEKAWEKPTKKFLERLRMWGKLGVGGRFAAYAGGLRWESVSVTSFLWRPCVKPMKI